MRRIGAWALEREAVPRGALFVLVVGATMKGVELLVDAVLAVAT